MAKLFTVPWRRARDDTDDTSAAKQVDVDPPLVDVTEVQRGSEAIEDDDGNLTIEDDDGNQSRAAVDLDPGADAIREGADEVADPSEDLFAGVSAEEQVDESELNPVEQLIDEVDPAGGEVAPAGTDGFESRWGEGGGATIPDVGDLGPTRPETPGMDEARSDTESTTKTLDDGSQAHHLKDYPSPSGSGWLVRTPDGGVLTGQEALDHIGEHLPTPAPGAADLAEPGVDPEWQQRMAESLEDHTHYGEIRTEALKGSEVNPDPMSDWETDATLDPTMDPSSPDFADPVDEPFEPVNTIDPADLDPGTIDPIEFE